MRLAAVSEGILPRFDPHFRLGEMLLVVRGGRSLSFVAAVLDRNVNRMSEIGGFG